MSFPVLLDKTFRQQATFSINDDFPRQTHKMIIKSDNPRILRNPDTLPMNPNSVNLAAPTVNRTDYITPGGTSSNFGMPAPGKLALSGATGRQGKLVYERLLDFYGRTPEEHLFYNRNIELAWGNVLYIGSFDDLSLAQLAENRLNQDWTLNFTYFKVYGKFITELPSNTKYNSAELGITKQINQSVSRVLGIG